MNLFVKHLRERHPEVSFLSKYPIPAGIPSIVKYPLPVYMTPLNSLSIENGELRLTSFSGALIGRSGLRIGNMECWWVHHNFLRITGSGSVIAIFPGEQQFVITEEEMCKGPHVKAGGFVLVLKASQAGKALNMEALKYLTKFRKELIGDGSILLDLVDSTDFQGMLKSEKVGKQ
jgi:hypothetical protein